MKKNDFSRKKIVGADERKLRRATSLFDVSSSLIESFAGKNYSEDESAERQHKAPKKQHSSSPMTFIPTSEECDQMPKLELAPSASMILGANPNYGSEAENANVKINHDFLEMNFDSPGPSAPIRQASKSSLMEEFGVDGEIDESSSAWVAKYFDQEQIEPTNFLNDKVKKEASPSLSPRAKNSPIETFKVNSKMRE